VTILPSLGGDFTLATGINDRGQVVGYSEIARHSYRLFLWDRQTGMRDLGYSSQGLPRLNNLGQIAGATEDASGVRQAFFWDPNGGMRLLGTLGGMSSEAHALNSRGQVVGAYQVGKTYYRAFLWDYSGGMRDLGDPNYGFRRAWAINDAGQIVAFASRGSFLLQVDEQGAVQACSRIPLIGLLGLNDKGAVVGLVRASQDRIDVAVWRAETGMQALSLDALQATTSGINDAGQVLYSQTHAAPVRLLGRTLLDSHPRYSLWDPKRGEIPIHRYVPLKRGESFWATDLNNEGCIVGAIQSTKKGTSRAVLLEPVPERWTGGQGGRP
jgi:probable HAF family extracellular repeat protein